MNRYAPAILFFTLSAMIVASLAFGATTLHPGRILELMIERSPQDFEIWNHRFPRTIIAVLVGAGMGAAGALIQGVVRNPLASPDILGVTQGAGLALSIAMLVFPQLPVGFIAPLACLGGAAGAGMLLLYNVGGFSPLRFALSGVAVSVTLSSVTEYLLLANPTEINTTLLTLTGSIWGRGWMHLYPLLPILPLIAVSLLISKQLDLIGLGDDTAAALGTRLNLTRWVAIALSVVLTSLTVSVAGPISFVGLVAPHIARRLFGGSHHGLIPAASVIGAVMVVFADTLGRSIAPPMEIPVGVLTAVVGAPYFLWLLFRIR